ncbi:MAG: type VI secretion lipoprotein TssJ [Thermodesulfobacteriota bacterium]
MVLTSLLLLPLVFSLACGGGKPKTASPDIIPITAEPGAPKYDYGSNAVILRLKADATLNQVDDQPHTLVLCVYQFSDPNAFQDLAKSKTGVIKLLNCQRFNEGVASVQKVILQPGESRNVILDRAEGAKFVGLAAGYFDLVPEKATRLIKVPVDVALKGWIFKDKYQIPARLDKRIFLGPSEIREEESP